MKDKKPILLYQKKFLEWDNAIFIILAAVIILIPVAFYRYSLPTFDPAKSLVLHLLTLIAFTLLALKIIITGHLSWQKTPLDKPVLFFLLFGSLSLIWSLNIYHSILTLPMFFTGPVLFFVISNSIKEQKYINRLLLIVISLGIVMGTYGILQYMGIDFKIWTGNIGRSRVMGLFGNVNYFAEYLILPLTLSLGLFLSKEKVFPRFFLFIALILMGIALLLTFTRGSYLAVAISIPIIIFLYQKSVAVDFQKKYYKKIVIYFLLLILIASALVFIPHPLNKKNMPLGKLKNRISITALTSDPAILRRIATWKFTWMMIKDHFILGSGLGTFDYRSLKYQTEFFTLDGNRDIYPYGVAAQAHNEYLQLWSELGMIGLFCFLWILFSYYRTILIHFRKMKGEDKALTIGLTGGVTAILIDALFGFPFQLSASLSLFWIFLGLTGAQINIINAREKENIIQIKTKEDPGKNKIITQYEGINIKKIMLSIFVIALMVALSLLLIRPFMVHVYWYHGNRQVAKGRYNEAIKYYEKGLKWNPWQGQLYCFIGNILTDRNISQLALEYFQEGERFTDNTYLPQNIAANYLKQGKVSNAIPYLEKAIQYQPDKERMLPLQLRLGNIYLTRKDYQNAERILSSAIENKPDNVEAYYGLAQAYIGQDKKELGKEALQKVIDLEPNSKVAGFAGTLLKKYEVEETMQEDLIE